MNVLQFRMAEPSRFGLSARPLRTTCAVHNNLLPLRLVTAMLLSFVVSFLTRKPHFAWRPDVDLSDPYVAAALAPMTHS